MKEKTEETAMQLSNEQQRFLELIQQDPLMIIEGFSSYDIKKPLIWIDRTKNKLTLQQISIKYRISYKSVRTILKNIKNNS